MKKPSAAPAGAPSAPRTARAGRSERDIGSRSKRPPRGQRGSEGPARREPSRQRSASSSRGGSPQRPRDVSAGSGARILAPLALVIFAIACFAVLTNQSGDGSVKASSTSSKSATTGSGATVKKTTRTTYRVKAGDSFAAIAEKTGISAEELQQLNPGVDPRALQPGQKLKLQ